MTPDQRCDEYVILLDDRWGSIRDQCDGEAGHLGEHFVVMTASMPLARMVWTAIPATQESK